MDLRAELFEVAKLLLSEEDPERIAETLFRRLLEATSAERGFVVVREGQSYQPKFELRYDHQAISKEERHFSRTLVRRVIESREILSSARLAEDERLAGAESARFLGSSSVLVAPLHHAGEVFAVLYLEHQDRRFSDEAQRFLAEFAEVAGLFIRRALDREALRARNRILEHDLFAQYDFKGIVTRHPSMLELLRVVAQVADSDATVLVLGETGTGKELIARALHMNSSRRARPFVALHCTALPATILESELFGHAKGAFTGADRDRAGRIASANGGTLFLDEIAEIPAELQAKLLRFLQFGEIQRLGSDRTEKVNVRIVAATHQDLAALIKAGRFRQDLYYRLNLIELHLPPLRERASDVPLLVEHCMKQHWRRAGETPRWTLRAERALASYDYPGNVRELAHLVERACLLAQGPALDMDLLPPELGIGAAAAVACEAEFRSLDNDELQAVREAAVAAVERRFLDALLKKHDGVVAVAARESGINRTYLQKLLARHRT